MGRSILNLPESSTDGDLLVKVHYHRNNSRFTVTQAASAVMWRTAHFTTTTPNATLMIKGQMWGAQNYSDGCGEYCELCNSNGSAIDSSWRSTDGKRYWGVSYAGVDNNASNIWAKFLLHWHQVYTNISPGTYEVVIGYETRNGSGGNRPFYTGNINSTEDGRSRQHESHCEIWEMKPGTGGMTNTSMADVGW